MRAGYKSHRTLFLRQDIDLRQGSAGTGRTLLIIDKKVPRITAIDIKDRVFVRIIIILAVVQIIPKRRIGRVTKIVQDAKTGIEKTGHGAARHLAYLARITIAKSIY